MHSILVLIANSGSTVASFIEETLNFYLLSQYQLEDGVLAPCSPVLREGYPEHPCQRRTMSIATAAPFTSKTPPP